MTCVIDISLLQFGQLSIVGTTEHARLVLMTLPFARQNVGASKRLTLDWVPVILKSKSWNWLGRFATAARSPRLLCAYYPQQSSKKETGYDASRMLLRSGCRAITISSSAGPSLCLYCSLEPTRHWIALGHGVDGFGRRRIFAPIPA